MARTQSSQFPGSVYFKLNFSGQIEQNPGFPIQGASTTVITVGSASISLPANARDGQFVFVKNDVGVGNNTLTPAAGDTIDGAAAYSLFANGQAVILQYYAAGNIWYSLTTGDISGSFTATLTGVTATTTGVVRYTLSPSGLVTLSIPTIVGTSNSTLCTLLGLPAILIPQSTTPLSSAIYLQNAGAFNLGLLQINQGPGDGIIQLDVLTSTTGIGNAFSPALGKGIINATVLYSLF